MGGNVAENNFWLKLIWPIQTDLSLSNTSYFYSISLGLKKKQKQKSFIIANMVIQFTQRKTKHKTNELNHGPGPIYFPA